MLRKACQDPNQIFGSLATLTKLFCKQQHASNCTKRQTISRKFNDKYMYVTDMGSFNDVVTSLVPRIHVRVDGDAVVGGVSQLVFTDRGTVATQRKKKRQCRSTTKIRQCCNTTRTRQCCTDDASREDECTKNSPTY